MDFIIETDRDFVGLDDELANSIWQLLVYSAPYDTGNLRSAIKKSVSNARRILFIYDETTAVYLKFLEDGVGFVKKHKGFISVVSLGEATMEVMYYAKTGQTTFSGVPIVVLRGRLNKKAGRSYGGGKPMGYEKTMLIDKRTQLTAKERSLLSKLYASRDKGAKFSYSGQSVITEKSPFTSSSRFSVKGMS